MAKAHNSFVLYLDSAALFDALDDKEAGQLIKAIFAYKESGCEPCFSDRGLKMAFTAIRSYLDRDEKKYNEKRVKNQKNALKKQWLADYRGQYQNDIEADEAFENWYTERMQSDAIANERMQSDGMGRKPERPDAKRADNVNDNDNVNDSANVSDSARGSVREGEGMPPNLYDAPTLEEITDYCIREGTPVNTAKAFFEHYEKRGWIDECGEPIVNWQRHLKAWM